MWALIAGGLCLFYFIGILLFAGVGSNFFLIWMALGAGLMSYGLLERAGAVERYVPVFLRRLTFLFVLCGLAVFLVVEGFIVSGFFAKGSQGLDYIIVLGAQVRQNGPSRVLKMRLDGALAYLEKNPGTRVIVSGGQGSNEPESEAACMKRYLMENGIEEARILTEDKSVNTKENLAFSGELIEKEGASVGIVSNNFHIFRSVRIARKLGYSKVDGIAASSYFFLQPNNMLREFFGVMKDFLCGNM